MDSLDKCLATLRPLIDVGDLKSILLGEGAVDEFIAGQADAELERKGLVEFEAAVTVYLRAPPSPRVEFANLIVAYIQSRIRALTKDCRPSKAPLGASTGATRNG